MRRLLPVRPPLGTLAGHYTPRNHNTVALSFMAGGAPRGARFCLSLSLYCPTAAVDGNEYSVYQHVLDPDRLERLGRYEVHLDRKLERMLTILIRLQNLRRTADPG